VPLGDHVLDILDRHVAPDEPRVHFGDERLKGSGALDASAHGVVQLGFGGERLDQRTGLPGHQPREVGQSYKLLMPPLLLESREHRRREQLGDPRHPTRLSHRQRLTNGSRGHEDPRSMTAVIVGGGYL
jgi:hypothetical protein